MEPDPRRERLAELRRQIEEVRRQIRPFPVGSPERNALADRHGELVGAAIALAEELGD